MKTKKIIILVSAGCLTMLAVISLAGWFLWGHFRKTTSSPAQSSKTVSATIHPQGNSFDAIQEYDKQCIAEEEPSLECGWLKGMVSAQIIEALETIEYSRDQRGVSEAQEALELTDEPEIQIAACRVLALFPNDPALAPKITPLLFSPYVEVQRISAQLLSRNPDLEVGGLGSQWSQNHQNVHSVTPYDELEIPSHYAKLGFPEYPGAVHFPPADSDRSVGWMTPDDVSTVESQLSAKLSVKSIGYEEWYQRSQQVYTKLAQAMDTSSVAEMQKLSEEYAKTQDPKIIEQMQTLQKKMSEPAEKATAEAEKAVNAVSYPRNGVPPQSVRYLIAEEREGRVSKLIAIYPDPAIRQTVIQTMWDLNDYQKAWPE